MCLKVAGGKWGGVEGHNFLSLIWGVGGMGVGGVER